jgi:DNA-binding transcriptional MerR regulator
MPSGPSRTYRVGEFARLAGVTPRALHHYDRLGLVKPRRTAAGYRAYSDQDLEKLVQVVALKFIGVPLKKIGRFTTTKAADLTVALRMQRLVLEEKRRLLDQAIGAIQDAEAALRGDGHAAPAVYRRIIEVIEMQSKNDWNAKYQGMVDAKVGRLGALPAEELTALRQQWTMLIEQVRTALADDPAGPRAQELATRWLHLLERLMGRPVDRSLITGGAAYQPDAKWAPSEADKPLWDFMHKALAQRQSRR